MSAASSAMCSAAGLSAALLSPAPSSLFLFPAQQHHPAAFLGSTCPAAPGRGIPAAGVVSSPPPPPSLPRQHVYRRRCFVAPWEGTTAGAGGAAGYGLTTTHDATRPLHRRRRRRISRGGGGMCLRVAKSAEEQLMVATTARDRRRAHGRNGAAILKDTIAITKNKDTVRVVTKDAKDTPLYAPPEWTRLDPVSRAKIAAMLSWESLSAWGFDTLELDALSDGHALILVGWALLGGPQSRRIMSQSASASTPAPAHTNMSSSVADDDDENDGYRFPARYAYSHETLCFFLRIVESEYDDNPYHNAAHAADVLQTTHALLQMGGKEELAPSEEGVLGILLAAVMHDVGHTGQNNLFHINAQTDAALLYRNVSVLENVHATRAVELLSDPTIGLLSNMGPKQRSSVMSTVAGAILHTDMAGHHAMVEAMRVLASSPTSAGASGGGGGGSFEEDAPLYYLLHLADVSNPAKPAPLFLDWTDRCLAEFFLQGDLEKSLGLPVSPTCDRIMVSRKGAQVGFIEYVVLPAYEAVAGVLPTVGETVLPVLRRNLEYWRSLPDDDDDEE